MRRAQMLPPNRGLFVTVEGGEGAGKSTLITKLKEELTKQGKAVLTTFEPGSTALGKEIRSLLLTVKKEVTLAPLAELLLFLADRAQHIQEEILPALQAGKIVICDRFNDSSIAYQGFARGLDLPTVAELCDAASSGLTPDLTLLLDIDPKIGLQRSKGAAKKEARAGELDRLESEALSFHQKLRDGFLWLADQNRERIKVLDASASSEAVFNHALRLLNHA